MLKNFHPASRHAVKSRLGMSLVEMLIAVSASVIVLASLMVVAVFVSTNLMAISNYSDLDKKSRNALDTMGRDIRNSTQLLSYATNSIIMSNLDTSTFSYTWDPSQTTFTRSFTNASGTVSATVLLTNCDYLSFNIYRRNPTNPPSGSYGPYFVSSAGAVNQTKLINVDWRCSRTILGVKRTTESVQTAQITIRN